MTRKKIFFLAAGVAGLVIFVVALPLFAVILLIVRDTFSSFIRSPYYLCELMTEDRLKEALANGFDPNAGCCAEHMIFDCSGGRTNSTPLVFAAGNGTLQDVEGLLRNGARDGRLTEDGCAISAAAQRGELEIVRALLKQGPSSECRAAALWMAGHFGEFEEAKLLLEGTDPEARTALCNQLSCNMITELQQIPSAKTEYHGKLLLHLVNTCADPNTLCEGGERLLSALARKEDHLPFVQALLDRGASLNAPLPNGRTVKEFLRSFNDYESRPKIKALIEGRTD